MRGKAWLHALRAREEPKTLQTMEGGLANRVGLRGWRIGKRKNGLAGAPGGQQVS